MVTLTKQHFEGVAPGTAITLANSGSTGDDPYDVVAVSGMALTFTNETAAHGTGALKFSGGVAGATGVVGWAGYNSTQQVIRRYYRFTGPPTTSDCVIGQLRSSTGQLFGIRYRIDGKLGIDGPDGSSVAVSSYTLPLNAWLRFEVAAAVAASGGAKLDVYNLDTGTSLGTVGATTGVSVPANIVGARAGKITAAAVMPDFYLDDDATKDGQLTYLGPYTAGPPTAAGTASSGQWVIDASSSVPFNSGGALTYAISPSTGVTQIAPGIFKGTTGGDYVVTVTETATGQGAPKTFTTTTAGASTSSSTGIGIKNRRKGAWV